MIIAETLKSLGVTDRKIYLYDTFKGMAAPAPEDKTVSGHVQAHTLWTKKQQGTHSERPLTSILGVTTFRSFSTAWIIAAA